MRLLACLIPLSLSLSISAFPDDQPKAEKQVRKITAMATDKTGRGLVSMSMADFLNVVRPRLVDDRRKIGLDYGSFFVEQKLLEYGAKLSDVQSGLKSGKTIWQIGAEQQADWNRIASDAKKLNGQIDDRIYRHFLNKKNYEADERRDFEDKYDPVRDAVRTDFNVTPKEIVDAQARYVFWRDQAGQLAGTGKKMTSDQWNAARLDHAGATHDTNGGISPPAAGGLPAR
jgi:hypothetical protein